MLAAGRNVKQFRNNAIELCVVTKSTSQLYPSSSSGYNCAV